jgi:predicted DNA-binding protein (UPF0251 family)
MLTPEEKVEARHIAIHGTQNMLMSLDHDDPITYLLDTVFGLSSKDAASVLEVSPDAYRQRLSRVRTKIEAFTYAHCALVMQSADVTGRFQLFDFERLDGQCSHHLPVRRM